MPKTYIAALVLIFGLAFSGVAQDVDSEPETRSITLRQELGLISDETKLHFTIEYYHKDAHHLSPMLDAPVEPRHGFKSAGDVLGFLKSQLQGVDVEIDATEPRVIHLVDGPLAQNTGNPMNHKITAKYAGTPTGLVASIRPLVGGLLEIRPAMADYARGDFVTQISFSANNLSVRSVLSDFLPLDGYNAILWIAETHGLIGKGNPVFVNFLDQPHRSSSSQPTTMPSVTKP